MCDLARPAESIVTKSVTLGELTRYGTKNYDRRVNRERREQPLPAFRVFRLASMDLRLERWVGRTLGFERDFSGTESNPQASARAAKLSRIVTCRSSGPATWPTRFSTATATPSGTASRPSSSMRSRATRPCGSGTPRSEPSACGGATAARKQPCSTATTARRWTWARSLPGRSGSTTTCCPLPSGRVVRCLVQFG